MKESKLTKKEIKKFEKDGILLIYPVFINCAYEIAKYFQEVYPLAEISITGSEGKYSLLIKKYIYDENDYLADERIS